MQIPSWEFRCSASAYNWHNIGAVMAPSTATALYLLMLLSIFAINIFVLKFFFQNFFFQFFFQGSNSRFLSVYKDETDALCICLMKKTVCSILVSSY